MKAAANTLEQLCEPGRNITYGVVKPGHEVEDGVRFIRGGDVFQGRIAEDVLRTISPQLSEQYKRTILQGGELLVSLVGSPGEVAVVPERLAGTNIARQVGLIPLGSQANPNFVMYFLRSPLGRAQLFTRTQGAVQQVINLSDLKTIEVPDISLDVQDRIASILSTYDDLIENNRRRIQMLEKAARILYKEWFVHFRFPGHEHVKIKNGVPEGWEKKLLGDIASTNVESYQMRELPDEICYIDISSVTQGRISTKTLLSSAEAPGRARRKAKPGDVIWSNVRPNLRGYALVIDLEEHDVFSTGFTVLSPVGVPFSYLYLLVTTDEFVSHLVNHATGVSYPAVRPDDFERAEVLVPSKQVMEAFHEKTEPSYRLISVLEKEIKVLTKARDILLPRLMNGEIAA